MVVPTPSEPMIPIFLLGISQRCGTNFLYRLLLEHPDCVSARQPGEDYLLHEAQHLERYVRQVAGHWNPDWDREGERTRDLAFSMGRGILQHLCPTETGRAFVSKTPSVANLRMLRWFVPEAKVLLLIRDGRDVVESGVRAFGWRYEDGFRRWAAGARELLAATARSADPSSPWEIVRFETLALEPERELRRVIHSCGLDPEIYDYQAPARLPVYGSSGLLEGDGNIHWRPQTKPPGFNPVGRWSHWPRALRRRYDKVCGALAEDLGYPRDPAGEGVSIKAWRTVRGRNQSS